MGNVNVRIFVMHAASAFAVAPLSLFWLGPAFAHTGAQPAIGLSAGLMHPLSGLDHALAAMTVGLLATTLLPGALPLIPLWFLLSMVAGLCLGLAGYGLPLVELAIGLSVLALGLAVLVQPRLPTSIAAIFVSAVAVFHGHAHAAEMPDGFSGLQYGLGLVLSTALLHAGGIAVGLGLRERQARQGRRGAQIIGGATTLAGAALVLFGTA